MRPYLTPKRLVLEAQIPLSKPNLGLDRAMQGWQWIFRRFQSVEENAYLLS
jgi:hypothetical protein